MHVLIRSVRTIGLSAVAALFFSAAINGAVAHASGPYSAKEIETQVKLESTSLAFAMCASQATPFTLDLLSPFIGQSAALAKLYVAAGDVHAGTPFNNVAYYATGTGNINRTVGYLTSSSGTVKCTELNMSSLADRYGWQTVDNMLCDGDLNPINLATKGASIAPYVFHIGQGDCATATGQYVFVAHGFDDTVKKLNAKASSSGKDKLDLRYADEGLYVSAMASLKQGCGASWVDAPGTTDYDKARTFPIKIVDSQGVVSDGYARISGDPTANVPYILSETGDNITKNCSYFAQDMIAHAGVYAKYVGLHKGTVAQEDTTGNGNDPTTGTSSCTIEGIGWIVCPVLKFMGGILDGAYKVVASLTQTPASILSDPAKQAWSAFRDIANVILVIAFMIIVFSQITGTGASNYGIKKMLPKLIIIAVLINISFFLCQLAVDLSNVVGGGVYSLLKNLPVFNAQAGGMKESFMGDAIAAIIGSQAILTTTGAVAAGALAIATTQGALVVILPVLIAALAAILVTVVVLVMRPALVIILTVLAPVAIASTLLPNLQNVYKKWQQYFVACLILFPMIALLFGGAQLAAAILAQSMSFTFSADGIKSNMGAAISIIVTMTLPLIAVLPMIKGSLNAIPLIGKAATAISSGGSKLSGFTRNKLKENGGLIAAYAQRNPKNAFAQSLSHGVHGRGIKIGGKVYGGAQATLRAANAAKSYNDSEVAAATYNTKDANVGDAVEMAKTGVWKNQPGKTGALDHAERLAVIDKAMASGGFNDRRSIVAALSKLDPTDSNSRELMNRANVAAYGKGDSGILGVGFGDDILDGKVKGESGVAQAAIGNLLGGKVTAEHLVGNPSGAKYLHEQVEAMEEGVQKQNARVKLANAVEKARTNDNTNSKIGDDLGEVFKNISAKDPTAGYIKDPEIAHEEALVQDALYNMNNPKGP